MKEKENKKDEKFVLYHLTDRNQSITTEEEPSLQNVTKKWIHM